MVFGKIEYLNLLPFEFFIKKSPHTYLKRAVKKSHPAVITELFLKRKVSAAFISSIKSRGKKCLNAGIVADGEVLSVFVCEGKDKEDTESKSSNILKKILNLKGEVVIGNKALQMYAKGNKRCIDLAKEWKKQEGLPFVFALFCINSKDEFYKKMIKRFLKSNIKIPYYIKKKEAKKLGLPLGVVELYLEKISYKIGEKERKSVKIFLKKAKMV
ncbi:MAG: hypothetical protein GXO12_02240 [Epsilonproteobacteria bacterium]|nr:hypothetical protein [Campylobacterota bacterium]